MCDVLCVMLSLLNPDLGYQLGNQEAYWITDLLLQHTKVRQQKERFFHELVLQFSAKV